MGVTRGGIRRLGFFRGEKTLVVGVTRGKKKGVNTRKSRKRIVTGFAGALLSSGDGGKDLGNERLPRRTNSGA